jgi:O-antigen/teichoic acid export membrane protein
VTSGALGRRVARGIGLLWVVRAGATLLQFAAFALIAAHLGPARVGIYAFALAFVELFRFVPDFGLGQVVARDVAQNPRREAELIPNLIFTRLALGTLGYLIVVAGLYAVGYDDARRDAALVAGASLPLLAATSAQVVMQVRLRLGFLAAADALKAVIAILGTVLLIRADASIVAFVWLYVAANVVAGVWLLVAAVRLAPLQWRFRPTVARALLRTAAPLALGILFIALYYRLDMAILARLKSSSDLGQYGVAYKFLDTFVLLPTLAATALAPVLARSVVEGRDVLERRLRDALRLAAVIALPIAVAGAMTAWRVVPELPGFEDYEGAGTALSILAPAGALIFFGTILQSVLINAHLQNRLLVIAAAGLVVNIALNAALIPPYSFVGAAVATTATEVLLLILSIRELRRGVGVGFVPTRAAKLLLANTALVVALLPGFALDPFVQLTIATAAYVAAVFVAGALTRADLAVFGRSRLGDPGPAAPSAG